MRTYTAEQKKKINERSAANNRRYRHENREKHLTAARAWHEKKRAENPSEYLLKRRLGQVKAAYGLLEEDLLSLLESQKNECVGCGTRLGVMSCSPDHLVAKNNGGTNSKSNFQLLCWPCNMAKHTMSMSDFIRLAHLIVKKNPDGAVGAFSPAFGKRGKAK